MMNCPQCQSPMIFGAPHSAEIKTQLECLSCGRIETEQYSADEQTAIVIAEKGYHYQKALKAVNVAGGNRELAELILQNRSGRISSDFRTASAVPDSDETTQLFWTCHCEGGKWKYIKFKVDQPVCLDCGCEHWNSGDSRVCDVTEKLLAMRDAILINADDCILDEELARLEKLFRLVTFGDVEISETVLIYLFKKEIF